MTSVKSAAVLCAVAVACSAGCSRKQEAAQSASPEVIPVRVEQVVLRDISRNLEYVGNVRAEEEITVFPKVSGKIIEKVKEDGAAVGKGETIAFIDRDEVGLSFEQAPVTSPLAGTVGRVYVDIGAHVTAQTPVALVVAMDSVKVVLDIPEQYLPALTLGQRADVEVDAFSDVSFEGKVSKMSPVVDVATRSAPIEITVENAAHRLMPGMFARVSLVLEKREQVPVVIKEALIGKEPEVYVYTVENGKARLKKIATGIRQGPLVEVTDGVSAGEKVVVMGQQRLYDGAPVSVGNGNGEKGG